MNTQAERHLSRAKDYIARGDQFYRKAKPEIHAAIEAGASQREVSRFLLRSQSWVRDVLAWDGEGTLYGSDTLDRQSRQTKQTLRDAPLEEVERIVADLPVERRRAISEAIEQTHPATAKRPPIEVASPDVGFLFEMAEASLRLKSAADLFVEQWDATVERASEEEQDVVRDDVAVAYLKLGMILDRERAEA